MNQTVPVFSPAPVTIDLVGIPVRISDRAFRINNHTWNTYGTGTLHDEEVLAFFSNEIAAREAQGLETTILDIGAQSGLFTLLADRFPRSRWHAFEADPTNCELLLENLGLQTPEVQDRVRVSQVALGDPSGSNERAILNVSSHTGLHMLATSFNQSQGELKQREIRTQIEVPLRSLDQLWDAGALGVLTSLDLLKIDTEGAELSILKGATRLLQTFRPKILMELHEPTLAYWGLTLKEVREYLTQIGYRISVQFRDDVFLVPVGTATP